MTNIGKERRGDDGEIPPPPFPSLFFLLERPDLSERIQEKIKGQARRFEPVRGSLLFLLSDVVSAAEKKVRERNKVVAETPTFPPSFFESVLIKSIIEGSP